MPQLEPNLAGLAWFGLLWSVCCIGFLQLAGMYPLGRRTVLPVTMTTILWAMLLAGTVLIAMSSQVKLPSLLALGFVAMALACRPKLLIADEPTTALDVTIQKQILDLLMQLQADRGMGLIFISHDLSVVRAVSDNVAVMQHGELVEYGSADQIFHHPQKDYTKRLINAAFDL